MRVLQNEEERGIEKKYHEALSCTNKSSGMDTHAYESVYYSWHSVYRLYLMWLSRFELNPCAYGGLD